MRMMMMTVVVMVMVMVMMVMTVVVVQCVMVKYLQPASRTDDSEQMNSRIMCCFPPEMCNVKQVSLEI